MSNDPRDICPRPARIDLGPCPPLAAPIHLSAVYQCGSPDEADALLSGATPGYVYGRDGHPNTDMLAARIAELHAAEVSTVCGSGMAALSAAALAVLSAGDHVLVSNQLYGRTVQLFTAELPRLGVSATVVDVHELPKVRAALQPNTRLIVAETISNPLLRVADIAGLAEAARQVGARLLMDNTFATPIACRPLDWGADIVVESLTKFINGHSDVVLGATCGRSEVLDRLAGVVATWGFSAGPFDCWLASRGLATLAVRYASAAANALGVARYLAKDARAGSVRYPGLDNHPDHALAVRQFNGSFGTMVSFELPDGRAAAERFIAAAAEIPFCPSLGDLTTTLSHPESTSHRGLSEAERTALGITGGTIRLSVGIESLESIQHALSAGLRAAAG